MRTGWGLVLVALAGLAGCGSGTPAPVGTVTPPVPLLALSATSAAFGNQPAGGTAATQTVTVTNPGTGPLVLSSVALTGSKEFGVGGSCSTVMAVAPGASCTIVVSFAPTVSAATMLAATVTVASNAAGPAQTIQATGLSFAGLGFTAGVNLSLRPVTGAALQLYAAGTTGNGSAATSIVSTNLTTDATGAVVVPVFYNCPSANSQLYLVSRGGAVGTGPSNNGVVLLSAVGPCSGLMPGLKVVVSEETTVAALVALAPFYGGVASIGASATNALGIANAFASAAELVNPATGKAPGVTLPVNAVAPVARVNSLANAVSACATAASACTTLYAAATVGSGAAPSNTADAVAAVVKNPANNVAAVYAATMGSQSFAPALTDVPRDWTMYLQLSGGGMNGPSGIGVDSTGSAWVASYFYTATKFSPSGGLVFGGGITGAGLNNSYGLAMDLKDNVWIPNEQPPTGASTGSVTELSPAGVSLAGPGGYTAGGLNYPISVAIDPNQTAWVVDYGNSYLTLLSPTGTPLSGSNGYTSPLFAFPTAVVVDGNHFGWVANQASNTVTKVAPDGSSFTNFDCCNGASGLAIDQSNDVWVANYYGDSVSLISNAGTVVSKGGYTGGGGINHPQGIAVDGGGNVWVANFRAPYLTELSGIQSAVVGKPITPAGGYGGDAALLEAYGIAIDASGNLWVSNFGNSTVTKFLGLAVPVKTPLSGTVKQP